MLTCNILFFDKGFRSNRKARRVDAENVKRKLSSRPCPFLSALQLWFVRGLAALWRSVCFRGTRFYALRLQFPFRKSIASDNRAEIPVLSIARTENKRSDHGYVQSSILHHLFVRVDGDDFSQVHIVRSKPQRLPHLALDVDRTFKNQRSVHLLRGYRSQSRALEFVLLPTGHHAAIVRLPN